MDYSIYLHVPFCKRRCHYCDFNTYAGKEHLIKTYIGSLLNEIRIVTSNQKLYKVHSIYFGGGTPSLIPLNEFKLILSELNNRFSISSDCEISLEANPGTLSLEYLGGLLDLGINRISLGVQSTNPYDLVRLDRIHNIQNILTSINNARKAGFRNINLDLIFGLPWQDLLSWKNSLSRALDLNPDHFSLYALIIEPGTKMYQWYQHGLIKEQDQDLEADMYELAIDMLSKHNYIHYEISNWAKTDIGKDYRCRHNLQYWRNRPYFGFGAGSHGYVDHIRTENVRRIPDYIRKFNSGNLAKFSFPASPAALSRMPVDRQTQMRDFMMLGLRLVKEGVSDERFFAEFGESMKSVFKSEIKSLLDYRLVEWVGEEESRLRLSDRGVMVGNQVFMNFV